MEKLIKEFLSNKKIRNKESLIILAVTLLETGIPWSGK